MAENNEKTELRNGLRRSAESVKHLIQALRLLAKKDDVMISMKYSTAIGVITGISTVVGGGLLTPLGLTSLGAIAGAGIGSVASSYFLHSKFKPLVTIIDEMSEKEKTELADHIMEAVSKFNITDVYKLIAALQSKENAIKMFVMEVVIGEAQRINNSSS